MRAAEEDLRATVLAYDTQDQRTDPIANACHFARDLGVTTDHAFSATEINNDMAEFDPFHDAGDDFARAILEFLILAFALRVADLLEYDLLRSLCCNAPEFDRGQGIDDEVPDGRSRLELFGILQVHLLEIVVNLLNDFDNAPQAHIARGRVDLRADVVFRAIAGTCGALDCVFHRFEHNGLVDQLLARDRVRDCEQFCLVG